MNISIKGRIYRSFFLFVFLFVVNGSITIITLYNNKRLSNHISDVIDPSLQAMEYFNKMMIESKMYATNWVFLRSNIEDKNALLKIHDSAYYQLKSKLNILSRSWQDKNSVLQLEAVFLKFEELLSVEKVIIGSLQKFENYDDPSTRMEAERIVEDEVIPRTAKLTATLGVLISRDQNVRAKQQDKLETSSSKLRVFILVLAVLIMCIGVLLSLYMASIIIKPINRIRNIVNDLGKGIIRKINQKFKKDEIGEMVRSVNNLSVKLEGNAIFAREVGLRNFDIPFEPLSEDDTLGKALITMRDNLKTSERELNEANSDMEILFRNIEEVFFSMDMVKHEFLQISPACETVFGYSFSDFRQNFNLLQDMMLEEDRQIAFDNYPLMVLGKPIAGEYRIRHKDKSIRWVETRITPTLNEMEKLVRIDGVTADITERKNAEFKLRESEEGYRLLVDNVKDYAIFMLDTDGKIISWNKGAEKMKGYSTADILGKDVSLFYTQKEIEADKPRQNLDMAKRHGSFSSEGLRVHKDGSEFWADVNFTALYDEKGNMRGFAQMIRDITKAKAAEKKIAEVSERLFLATHAANIGIWDLNIVNNELIWDDNMYGLYGKKAENFSGALEAWQAALHPDDLKHASSEVEMAINGKKQFDTEFRVIWDDNTVHFIKAFGKVQRDASGKALRIIGTNWDITDKKQAEELLLKSEANLRTIFDNTELGYVLLDADLKIVSFNNLARAYAKGKYKKDLAEGNNLMDYISVERRPTLKNVLDKLVNGEIHTYETNYCTDNGLIKWFEIGWISVSNKEKKNWGFILTNLDITEKKIAELERERITADLVQRNKDLEQFTYIVSHNLRAPVANMMGLSSLLDNGSIDITQKEKIVGGISLSVKNLNTVITDINNILQTKRQLSGENEIVGFSALVNNIKASISNVIETENVKIECNFSEVGQIWTLKSYLHSIFYNIISNSIKYRQKGIAPLITITSHLINGAIQLIFKDNGKGIDLEKNYDQLFGLYKRFDSTVDGKGMGLFMVKSQIQTLGGHISVESELNKGTTFKVEFPG